MTVKELFVYAAATCNVILKDADDAVLFAGNFTDFPYKYANYFIHEYRPVGSSLVIWIFN